MQNFGRDDDLIGLLGNPKTDEHAVRDPSLFTFRKVWVPSSDYGINAQLVYYFQYGGHLRRVHYSLIDVHIIKNIIFHNMVYMCRGNSKELWITHSPISEHNW